MPAPKRKSPKRRATAGSKRHEVRMKMPPGGFEIGKSDIRFDILDRTDRKIGTLLVSRGALEWKSFNSPKRRKYTWDRFDALMIEGKTR